MLIFSFSLSYDFCSPKNVLSSQTDLLRPHFDFNISLIMINKEHWTHVTLVLSGHWSGEHYDIDRDTSATYLV